MSIPEIRLETIAPLNRMAGATSSYPRVRDRGGYRDMSRNAVIPGGQL